MPRGRQGASGFKAAATRIRKICLAGCLRKERKENKNEESNEKNESSDCSSHGVRISDV